MQQVVWSGNEHKAPWARFVHRDRFSSPINGRNRVINYCALTNTNRFLFIADSQYYWLFYWCILSIRFRIRYPQNSKLILVKPSQWKNRDQCLENTGLNAVMLISIKTNEFALCFINLVLLDSGTEMFASVILLIKDK